MDPAVGVHRIPWNLLHNAVNGVPDVLPAGHQQACSHQDDKGGLDTGFKLHTVVENISYLVVQPKYCIVDAYFVKLDQTLHRPKHIQHDSVTF